MAPDRSALLFALTSSVLSSLAVIFQCNATKSLGTLIVACFGPLSAGTAWLIFLRMRGRLPSWEKIKAARRSLILIIILGAFFRTLLFVHATALTTGIKAMFFSKVEPYFILFWLWIYKKESTSLAHILLLAVHILGAFLLSTGGSFSLGESQLGDLLIIIAMCFSGLAYISGTNSAQQIGGVQAAAIYQFVGGFVLLPFAIIFSDSASWSNLEGWRYLSVHTILFHFLSLPFWFAAIKDLKGWVVSALRAVGPLIAAPFAWFFFGDELDTIQIAGGGIVLITSALIARGEIRINKA